MSTLGEELGVEGAEDHEFMVKDRATIRGAFTTHVMVMTGFVSGRYYFSLKYLEESSSITYRLNLSLHTRFELVMTGTGIEG